MLFKCLVVALAIAAAVAAPASAQVVDVPSESECVADQKAMSDALQAFLVTLVTRTCNLRMGYDHVCEAPCQAAIANIGTVAKGCLRYPSFGDTVFDMMRTTAENAGLGGEVPPKQAMNMTELNDWAVEYVCVPPKRHPRPPSMTHGYPTLSKHPLTPRRSPDIICVFI